MSRYICIDGIETLIELEDALKYAPSIDIVRCKECKYYNGNEEYCSVDHYATEDGFCSYGEVNNN